MFGLGYYEWFMIFFHCTEIFLLGLNLVGVAFLAMTSFPMQMLTNPVTRKMMGSPLNLFKNPETLPKKDEDLMPIPFQGTGMQNGSEMSMIGPGSIPSIPSHVQEMVRLFQPNYNHNLGAAKFNGDMNRLNKQDKQIKDVREKTSNLNLPEEKEDILNKVLDELD